jgi:hypothetical protein
MVSMLQHSGQQGHHQALSSPVGEAGDELCGSGHVCFLFHLSTRGMAPCCNWTAQRPSRAVKLPLAGKGNTLH